MKNKNRLLIVTTLFSAVAFAGLERHSHLMAAYQSESRAIDDTRIGRPDAALTELTPALNQLNAAVSSGRGFGGHRVVAVSAVTASQSLLTQAQSIVGPALYNLQQAQLVLQQA